MILRSLYNLYDRLADELPPMGKAYVKFVYAIVIDKEGHFLSFERLGDENGLNILTARPEERASVPVPHLMGDNGSYVLSLKKVVPEKTDLAKEMHSNEKNFKTFVDNAHRLHAKLPDNDYAAAVSRFYDHYGEEVLSKMAHDPEWQNVCKLLDNNLTFRIKGKTFLAVADQELLELHAKEEENSNDNPERICLITGKSGRPVSTTTSTFIPGGKSKAKLVAFQVKRGYDSYGKAQGLNAPISVEEEFKYTTALQYLLRSGSRNKFSLGNRTYIFWASGKSDNSSRVEECVYSFFGGRGNDEEDREGSPLQVVKVLKAIYSGTLQTSLDERFYILGLAPNAARISVVFWSDLPLAEFAGKLLHHFDDMEIVGSGNNVDKPYKGLYSILSVITPSRKAADATPNLADAIAKSIFLGIPYPMTLMESCVQRIRAEHEIGRTRAAILKASLIRLNDYNNKKITTMLDKENTNAGYLCGRLFAVLENLQYAANRQESIRASYMNAASATPSAVFPTILKLSNDHYSKLLKDKERGGLASFFDREKREIMAHLQDFPNTLSLGDQGRFFLGYYHQRQDLFTKKSTETTDDEAK